MASTDRRPAHARPTAGQYRRRRVGLGIVVAGLGSLVGLVSTSGAPPAKTRSSASGGTSRATTRIARPVGTAATPRLVTARLEAWKLAAPISREVVLPGPNSSRLLVAGGLDASGGTGQGIFSLDTQNGALTSIGTLASATHDAAGAALGGVNLVIGGGVSGPTAAAQRFDASGRALGSGTLPAARADATAVTIGALAYTVGGYDGPSLDAEVLATSDGSHFAPVAVLPVPVRYPALAVLGGAIYVFGGQDASGTPVADIQVVDPATHSARVVGSLPAPVAGAVAANLGGTIYVVGGVVGNGTSTSVPTAAIYGFDATTRHMLRVGTLPVALSNAGAAVLGDRLFVVGGETVGGTPSADVQTVTPNAGHRARTHSAR